MSTRNPNTECKVCGKSYYSCKTCGEINHWKSIACSPEHFVEYVNAVNEARKEKEETVTFENKDETVDIATTSNKKKRAKISEALE